MLSLYFIWQQTGTQCKDGCSHMSGAFLTLNSQQEPILRCCMVLTHQLTGTGDAGHTEGPGMASTWSRKSPQQGQHLHFSETHEAIAGHTRCLQWNYDERALNFPNGKHEAEVIHPWCQLAMISIILLPSPEQSWPYTYETMQRKLPSILVVLPQQPRRQPVIRNTHFPCRILHCTQNICVGKDGADSWSQKEQDTTAAALAVVLISKFITLPGHQEHARKFLHNDPNTACVKWWIYCLPGV